MQQYKKVSSDFLSPREKRAFQLLVEYKTTEEIAKEMGLTLGSTKQIFALAIQRSGMPNRLALTLWLIRQGLIDLGGEENAAEGNVHSSR